MKTELKHDFFYEGVFCFPSHHVFQDFLHVKC